MNKQPQKLSSDALELAAKRGVARALDARKAAGVELSDADVQNVSGGALAAKYIINGGRPLPFENVAINAAVNPAVNPAAGLGGLAGQLGGQLAF